MSTISNERLESLQRQFKEEGFNDISDSEIMQLVEENLALRKEREKAEPEFYGPYTPVMMGAGVWVSIADELPPHLEGRKVWVTTAPPAPVDVPNELVSELLDIAKRAAEEADECAYFEFSDNSMKHACEIAEWEKRAAMLKGADDAAS